MLIWCNGSLIWFTYLFSLHINLGQARDWFIFFLIWQAVKLDKDWVWVARGGFDWGWCHFVHRKIYSCAAYTEWWFDLIWQNMLKYMQSAVNSCVMKYKHMKNNNSADNFWGLERKLYFEKVRRPLLNKGTCVNDFVQPNQTKHKITIQNLLLSYIIYLSLHPWK